MRKQRIVFSIIITLIVFSSFAYQKSVSVTDWVEQTLLQSCSLNFLDSQSNNSPVRFRFTTNGWRALSQFLAPYASGNLTGSNSFFHPIALSQPTLVESGIVTQSYFFSALVIETTDKHFLIQSLDMTAQ